MKVAISSPVGGGITALSQAGESHLCCFMQEQVSQKVSPSGMGLEQRRRHGQEVDTSQTQLLPESPVAFLEQKTYKGHHVLLGKGESLL